MRAHNGHADAGAADLQFGQVQDLLTLVLHLHFLLGVAVVQHITDVGNDIEGDLMGEGLALYGLALGNGFHLAFQFLQTGLNGTGHCLIGAGGHGFDGRNLIQCGNCH